MTFGANKPKGLNRIGNIGQGHLTLSSGRMITSSGIGPVIIIVVFMIE